MSTKPIRSALISVFYKDGLEPVIRELDRLGVQIFSTGGTQQFIQSLGVSVQTVEDLTTDRKSTRLNSSHLSRSRMPSSA